MQLLQINFLEGSSTVLGAMVYRRNKMARGLSQSHDVNAKRTRFSRDDDCQGAVVAPEDDSNIIDISDLVSRDEAPTDSENEAKGVTGSRRIRPANDFPYSLAQWVHYRNKWVLIPDWHFRTDAQHVPECDCRFCETLKFVTNESEESNQISAGGGMFTKQKPLPAICTGQNQIQHATVQVATTFEI